MPTITTDEAGNSLYYEDTGVPPLVDASMAYTTLMIVHGTAFHGAIFQRVLPLAGKHNLRLVIVNRRDYPGSSPYSDEELDKIRIPNAEADVDFAKARAKEFATFIRRFVEQNDIPQAAEDGESGGVVLMGWSAGSHFIFPVIAFPDAIDEVTRAKIEPYLRSLTLFDMPQCFIGSPYPEHGNAILKDASLSPTERAARFNSYVSGYYAHSQECIASRDVDALQLVPDTLRRPSTLDTMSGEQLASLIHYAAVGPGRSEMLARLGGAELYAKRVRRAFFGREELNADGNLNQAQLLKLFPQCRIDIVWGENTIYDSICTSWILEKIIAEADAQGVPRRAVRSYMIPGPDANHFIHWDNPEKAMDYFTKAISA